LHASFKNQDDMTYYYYRDIILKQQKRRQTTKQNFAIIPMVNFMNLKFRYIYISFGKLKNHHQYLNLDYAL
jgi:hypothetical protein